MAPDDPRWEQALRGVVADASSDVLGELLRDLTFVGDGYGCYSTFDVREDAEEWLEGRRRSFWNAYPAGYDDEEKAGFVEEAVSFGNGYSWWLGGFRIDCCWYWDGDGTLCFEVVDGEKKLRVIENADCKKDYGWDDWVRTDTGGL